MDRYELVLEIIEHPEKYSADRLSEILSEPETKEIYNLLCKTDSAIEADKEIDVNAEWNNFADMYAVRPRRSFSWFGSRAASIVAIVGTSIVAVAAGIAVTVSVIDRQPEPIADEATVAPAAVSLTTDTISVRDNTAKVNLSPVMFENEPLDKIMKKIAEAYGVQVKFNSSETASLHLYYKLDPSLPLDEVVEQLNTFEQINIRQDGDILNID